MVKSASRSGGAPGVVLTPLERMTAENQIRYSAVSVEIARTRGTAVITISGPDSVPTDMDEFLATGDQNWPIRCARELDDALLHLRFNEEKVGVLIFKTRGDQKLAIAMDQFSRFQRSPLAGPRDITELEPGAKTHRSHLAIFGCAH